MDAIQPDFIASKTGKKLRVLAQHKKRMLEICQIGFTEKGSFYFILTGVLMQDLKFGRAFLNKEEKKFEKEESDKVFKCASGFHVSLHPPPGNCLHIRANQKGPIMETIKNFWYPVSTPRNVLRFWTAPLLNLRDSLKKSCLSIPVPDNHSGSIYGKIDFYPSNTNKHYLPQNAYNRIYGISPLYQINISFMLAPAIDPHIIYPESANQL
jgi:hypothetical protein